MLMILLNYKPVCVCVCVCVHACMHVYSCIMSDVLMKALKCGPSLCSKAVLQYLVLQPEVNVNVQPNARIELGSILAFVVRLH